MANVAKGNGIDDPRQLKFIKLYLTPGTRYFNNALQSGLAAGYSQKYSENILDKDLDWLQKAVGEIVGKPTDKKNLVREAKRVLAQSLLSEDEKLAQDTAKFIAKTDPEFSEKHENTIIVPRPILELNEGEDVSENNSN